jgi:predicted amidohydrolase YtcJ
MNPAKTHCKADARKSHLTSKHQLSRKKSAVRSPTRSQEFTWLFIFLSIGLFTMNLSFADDPKADLIYIEAKIWTGVPASPFAEAIAIADNKILAVGSNKEILEMKGTQTRVQALQGALVMPGFIDNHTHFLEGGFQLMSIDLRPARDEREFQKLLKEKARELPAGKWITGGNWDHESWLGARLPTRNLIDAITPKHPVFIRRLDGHMGLANSLALRLAGVTVSTPVPPGGEIVKDPGTGEPTGILKDAAMEMVERIIPPHSSEEEDMAFSLAMKEAARLGVTSVQDVTSWKSWEVFHRADQARRLTLRFYCRTPLSQWEMQRELIKSKGAGDDWIKLGGLKAFMDGSLGSTTAYFFDPYLDAPATAGLLADDLIPEEAFKKRIQAADQAGLQLSIHAIGDRANHLLLDYYQLLTQQAQPRDRRHRIEHAQHLAAADIPRFAALGVIASMQPAHLIDDGRWAEKRLGPVRVKGSYVFNSLLKNQAVVCFGTDWPIAPLNPLNGIYAAVTRRTEDDKHPAGWIPEEKISLEEALRCYTQRSAFASYEEKIKGTLEPGKLADLIVLDRDLFNLPPEKIREAKVLCTIVNGKVVFREDSFPEATTMR